MNLLILVVCPNVFVTIVIINFLQWKKELRARQNMTEVDDATSLTSHQESKDWRVHCQLPHWSLNLMMLHPSLCSLCAVIFPTGHPVTWKLVYLSIWAHQSQSPVDNEWQLSRVAFKGCMKLSSLSKLSIPSAGMDSWCLTFNNKQTTRRRTWRRV